MVGQGGDDLEDDYVPDELVASSGDEEEDSRHGSSHGDLSLDDDALKPSGSAAPLEGGKSNKRKRSGKDKQRKLKVNASIRPLDVPETKHSRAEAQAKGDAGRTVFANLSTVTFGTR